MKRKRIFLEKVTIKIIKYRVQGRYLSYYQIT